MVTFNSPEDADTELRTLLLKCVPENARGRKTLTHLAALIPISRSALHKIISKQRIPAYRVDRLMEIGQIGESDGRGRVKRADFEKFVFNY